MLAKVRRWGNGLALRVHKRDLESAGVAEGDVVQVELIRSPERGRLDLASLPTFEDDDKRANGTTGTSTGERVEIADTSFLYALFSKSDVFHGKARKAAASADSLLVPDEIYSETVALIHYRVGFAAAKLARAWMRAQKRVQVAPSSRSLLDGGWGIV